MNNKSKMFMGMFVAGALAVSTFAACAEPHTHSYSDKWTSNADYHWHAPTCDDTTEVVDKAAHSWNAGEVTTLPDCETDGVKTFTCEDCEATKTEPVAASGHDYGEVEFVWNGYTSAKAVRVCENNEEHVDEVEAEITSAYNGDCNAIVYTATATVDGKTVSAQKTDNSIGTQHDYDENAIFAWTWNEQNETYTATAHLVCKRDEAHKTSETDATVTVAEGKADCEGKATITYQATVEIGGKTYTATNTHEVKAIGHNYEVDEDAVVWNDDRTSVDVTLVCKNDETHTHVVTVTGTDITSVTETYCEEEGYTKYTATFTYNDQSFTVEKTDTEAATGHNFEYVFTWADDYTATVSYECLNECGEASEAVDATVTNDIDGENCGGKNVVTYTASYTLDGGKVVTDTKTGPMDADLHQYAGAVFTWAENEDGTFTVTATRTCKYDADENHVLTTNAKVTASANTATCEEGGEIVYTATVEIGGDTFTDTKTVETEALGHKYADTLSSDETGHWYACLNGCTEKKDFAEHNAQEEYIPAAHTDWATQEVTYVHSLLCNDCNYAIVDEEECTWNTGVVTVEPTKYTYGEKTYTCTVCDQHKKEQVDTSESLEVGSNAVESVVPYMGYIDANTGKELVPDEDGYYTVMRWVRYGDDYIFEVYGGFYTANWGTVTDAVNGGVIDSEEDAIANGYEYKEVKVLGENLAPNMEANESPIETYYVARFVAPKDGTYSFSYESECGEIYLILSKDGDSSYYGSVSSSYTTGNVVWLNEGDVIRFDSIYVSGYSTDLPDAKTMTFDIVIDDTVGTKADNPFNITSHSYHDTDYNIEAGATAYYNVSKLEYYSKFTLTADATADYEVVVDGQTYTAVGGVVEFALSLKNGLAFTVKNNGEKAITLNVDNAEAVDPALIIKTGENVKTYTVAELTTGNGVLLTFIPEDAGVTGKKFKFTMVQTEENNASIVGKYDAGWTLQVKIGNKGTSYTETFTQTVYASGYKLCFSAVDGSYDTAATELTFKIVIEEYVVGSTASDAINAYAADNSQHFKAVEIPNITVKAGKATYYKAIGYDNSSFTTDKAIVITVTTGDIADMKLYIGTKADNMNLVELTNGVYVFNYKTTTIMGFENNGATDMVFSFELMEASDVPTEPEEDDTSGLVFGENTLNVTAGLSYEKPITFTSAEGGHFTLTLDQTANPDAQVWDEGGWNLLCGFDNNLDSYTTSYSFELEAGGSITFNIGVYSEQAATVTLTIGEYVAPVIPSLNLGANKGTEASVQGTVYQFTPAEDGTYKFTIYQNTGAIMVLVGEKFTGTYLALNTSSGITEGTIELVGGTSYNVVVMSEAAGVYCNLVIEKAEEDENAITAVGEYALEGSGDMFNGNKYTFTAPEAGKYTFAVSGDGADICFEYGMDSDLPGNGESVTYTMAAGEVVKIDCVESCTVTITKA